MTQTSLSESSLCPCGTGIRHELCCKRGKIPVASPEDMAKFEPDVRRARDLRSRGDTEASSEVCVTILEQMPSHTGALEVLYNIHKKANHKQAAEVLVTRLVKINPNNGEFNAGIALLLYMRKELGTAEHHARNAVRVAPRFAQAHNVLGMILTEQNRALAGEFHYRRAIELHKPIGKLCANLGTNLKNQGKLDEAEAYYRQANELEPKNSHTLITWAKLEEARRNIDNARELLNRAEAVEPDNASIDLVRASLFTRERDYDSALDLLDRIRRNYDRKEKELGPTYFTELGRLYDKMGHYDDAFAAIDQANRLTREQGHGVYKREHAEQLATKLKNFFKRSRMKLMPRATLREDAPQPIFIIGFPRSGTTMSEQILTAHSQISAGDELTFIGDLTRFGQNMLNSPFKYPECLADLWLGDNQETLDTFRDFYIKRTQQLGILDSDCRWFTDKMPLNETHLGLIHMVFPYSPVMHLIRHPLDVILSTYFTDLTHGFCCSYQLETAASHYLLIRDLVNHYLEQLDINYRAIRYEDIVTDQENKTREMLEFVGAKWESQCLDFHQNMRYARTASYVQVTEKLYTSSKFRYKNYLEHLAPIISMLEPVIEELGYTIEEVTGETEESGTKHLR